MNQPLVKITIGTHFFKLTHINHNLKPIIIDFARRYIKYGLIKERGVFKKTPLAVFGAATKNREEFRFHINQYAEFLEMLRNRNYTENLFEIIRKPIPTGVPMELNVKPMWTLRDYQKPVFEYLIDPVGPKSRLVELQTGEGKTLSSLYSLAKIGVRFALLIRPMFIFKWVGDVQKYLDIKPEEIMMVQGGKNLQALIQLALTDQLTDYKVIIISNKTYQGWLSAYEEHSGATEELGYPIAPDDLFEAIGCGVRLIDEIHLDLHLQFKTDLYTNINESIGLSGTFLSTDRFVEKVQEIMYPLDDRYKGGPLKRYVSAFAAFYTIDNMEYIRTSERGSDSYSHTAYEKSIRKSPEQLANYVKMVRHLVDNFHMEDYKPGERCLVFAASISMCTDITDYLTVAYPLLNVNRFVEDDPDENLYESDICVTTVLSGGTAHDVANLKTVIMTNSLDSKASNIQVLGRLRKSDTMVTRFIYLVCPDIPKQLSYHMTKKILLAERAKNYREYTVPFHI